MVRINLNIPQGCVAMHVLVNDESDALAVYPMDEEDSETFREMIEDTDTVGDPFAYMLYLAFSGIQSQMIPAEYRDEFVQFIRDGGAEKGF